MADRVSDNPFSVRTIALVVLGAFSMGVSAAYLKFSESPWYENALTYLVLIPLIVAACMIASLPLSRATEYVWRRLKWRS